MQHTKIDFNRFQELCSILLNKVQQKNRQYRAILCPLKGGFFLSYYMQKKLKIPITYLEISSYNGKQQQDFIIGIKPELDSDRFLLCDDIYDSGNTIKKIHEMYPHAHFDVACLVSKVDNNETVMHGEHIDHDGWVDFFWETL